MSNQQTCRECPKWDKGWCKHYASQFVPEHPACQNGKKLITSAKIWKTRRENASAS